MAHLKRHVGVSFQYLNQTRMKVTYVKSGDNKADAFTKALPGPQVKYLMEDIFDMTNTAESDSEQEELWSTYAD